MRLYGNTLDRTGKSTSLERRHVGTCVHDTRFSPGQKRFYFSIYTYTDAL